MAQTSSVNKGHNLHKRMGGLCILLERRICRDISNKWTTRSPTHIAPFFGVNRLDLFAAFGEITNAQCDQIG